MKLSSFSQSVAGLLLVSLLVFASSCKNSSAVDPTKGFSAKIQSIISQSDIDALRAKGMVINEGSQPPNIEGIFASSPHRLVSPYGPKDTYAVGHDFSDLIMRFSGQNSTDQTALVEIKNAGSTGSGQGGFLAGNGQKFTFFAEVDLVSGAATAKQIRIFTGEITATGIKDFYTTLLVKSKVDPNDELIPVGSARILKDGDGLASKRSSFRRSAEDLATAEEGRK
ncbi:hypothetical protein [Fibrella aquatilis]|uniref:Lipoprotein n=1 Tax=Fibrella aquatilis TaxID=2817059 RepID=A0A939G336_9BACT|nr:hypothetical protein [Fibrella aquatilis]MBO0931006.1 hypothetical protein [Fibrella aquatilis]